MKIRTKIYTTFVALGIILTLGGVTIYYRFFASNLESTVAGHLENTLEIRESGINHVIDKNVSDLKEIATREVFQYNDGNFDKLEVEQELIDIVDYDKSKEQAFLIDYEGKIIASNIPSEEGDFLDVVPELATNFLVPYVDKLSHDKDTGFYYYILSPVLENNSNEAHFILAFKYNTDEIINVIDSDIGIKDSEESLLAIKDNGYLRFLNKDYCKEISQCNEENVAEAMVLAINRHRGVSMSSLDHSGEPVIAAYTYLDNLQAGFIVKVDRSDALGFLDRMFLVSVIIGFIIILLDYLVVNIMGRNISEPIEKLNKGASILADGNFEYKLEEIGDDEVRVAAKAFNKLSDTIKSNQESFQSRIESQTEDLRNQQIAILNILEDVEEEKEKVADGARELEKFRLAVENTSDHVVITDEDGIILYANPAVEKITGFSPNEVIGKKVGTKENWGGVMGAEFYDNLWYTLKKEKKSFSGYLKNMRKNGELYEALANISPIFDAGGNVRFFVGIERDFTREREIDRAKSEFVSLASHQLRTPLSTVNWYAEILLSEDAGKINDEQKDYLNEIYKGNQRMVNLVNALLNVSRIDLGTLAVEPELTDLKDLSESVLGELKPKLIERKHKVVKKYDKTIPKINLDPKLMRIVFQNYLTNAVKYTPEKGQIEVGIIKKGKFAQIYVKDNGMGIPEKQQPRIWEKLFRADNVRERETDGTGLGLYIVKSVIEQFGGEVWFESTENQGSTFYATVPLAGIKAKEGSKGLEFMA